MAETLAVLAEVLAVTAGVLLGTTIRRALFGPERKEIQVRIEIDAPSLTPEEWTALGTEISIAVSEALKTSIREVKLGKRN